MLRWLELEDLQLTLFYSLMGLALLLTLIEISGGDVVTWALYAQ